MFSKFRIRRALLPEKVWWPVEISVDRGSEGKGKIEQRNLDSSEAQNYAG